MPNFKDALKVKVADIERPPASPPGEYRFVVKKLPTLTEGAFKDKNGNNYDTLDFQLQAVQALDSVDPESLANFGGFKNVSVRKRFMFNNDDEARFGQTMFSLRQFFEMHLQCAGPDDTMAVAMNNSVNKQCIGTVSNRPDERNPEIVYSEVGATAPIE